MQLFSHLKVTPHPKGQLNLRTSYCKHGILECVVWYTELSQLLYLVVICNYVFQPYISVQHCKESVCYKIASTVSWSSEQLLSVQCSHSMQNIWSVCRIIALDWDAKFLNVTKFQPEYCTWYHPALLIGTSRKLAACVIQAAFKPGFGRNQWMQTETAEVSTRLD